VKAEKFMPLLVAVTGFLAYHNSFFGPFVFDDTLHISENRHIRQLWPPWNLLTHSSRPVVDLSLAVNYALGRFDPWGYHLFNLAIHILAALTLCGVLRRTFLSERLRPSFGRAAWSLAGVIALIWLVHPLQTESVTYTIQRAESLMSLFYLLTLYCVIRSNDASQENLWKVGAVASCALGMACKPVMITAPVVALLYDRAFLGKSWRDLRRRRAWLYTGLAASWLLLPPLLANGAADWKTSAGFEFKEIPPLQYARMQPVVIVRYLRLAFWPHLLCLDYGWRYHWRTVLGAADVLPDLIVVMALLALTVWAWNRQPALGFLGASFFLLLAPTSGFIPIADPIAEHRMYLPLAAVVTAAVIAVFALGKRLLVNPSAPVLGWMASGLVIVPLTLLTIQRNHEYISEVAIWQDTAAKCPNNPRAHNCLGLALTELGRMPESIEQYEQALRIKPDYAEAHNNLGNALRQVGRLEEAIRHFEQALEIKPNFVEVEVHNDLGNALAQAGRIEEAITHYQLALRINPEWAETHYNLGNALARAGKIEKAIAQYQLALRINPDFVDAHNNLGTALAQAGRIEEAITHYQLALRINPEYAEAHKNLGITLEQAGRVPEAIQHYKQALRLQPDLIAARNALARLQAGQ
jgi:tetratricopeptide (TPR) repeat protein